MEDIHKDIKEIFGRLNTVEKEVSVFKVAKDNILEKVNELKELLAYHSTIESKKFKEFGDQQKQILKFMYIGTGVGITLQIVVMPLVLYIVLGK